MDVGSAGGADLELTIAELGRVTSATATFSAAGGTLTVYALDQATDTSVSGLVTLSADSGGTINFVGATQFSSLSAGAGTIDADADVETTAGNLDLTSSGTSAAAVDLAINVDLKSFVRFWRLLGVCFFYL